MLKTWKGSGPFSSADAEKWHAAVARSAFASQNLKGWEFKASLEVTMSKNGTPLCKAHLHVKMYKTPHVRTTF